MSDRSEIIAALQATGDTRKGLDKKSTAWLTERLAARQAEAAPVVEAAPEAPTVEPEAPAVAADDDGALAVQHVTPGMIVAFPGTGYGTVTTVEQQQQRSIRLTFADGRLPEVIVDRATLVTVDDRQKPRQRVTSSAATFPLGSKSIVVDAVALALTDVATGAAIAGHALTVTAEAAQPVVDALTAHMRWMMQVDRGANAYREIRLRQVRTAIIAAFPDHTTPPKGTRGAKTERPARMTAAERVEALDESLKAARLAKAAHVAAHKAARA